jgi:UDP-glucose 4-epimerase
VDGTAEHVRRALDVPFGVAGLTLPDRGRPVPSRLLAGELARLGADFTFLRRSFWADTAGHDLHVAVPRIAAACTAARRRTSAQVLADRADLVGAVALSSLALSPGGAAGMSAGRALVLGAGGFVGRHLCARLRADGWDVVATVRPGAQGGVPDGVRDAVPVDLADPAALTAAVRAVDPDVAFHLAAGRARATPAERVATSAVNAGSGLHLVEALGDRCRAVVRLGSSTEYAAVDGPMDETAPLAPRGFFGATKAAGSLLLAAAAHERGLRSAVLRAFQVYGPGDHEGRLVPTVLRAARDATVLPLTAPGARRDWVHVDDVVDACVRAAQADDLPPGSVLNVGTGRRRPTRSSSRPPNGPPADRCAPPSAPTRAAPGTPARGCATRRSPAGCSGGSPWSSSRTGCAGAGRPCEGCRRGRGPRPPQRRDPRGAGGALAAALDGRAWSVLLVSTPVPTTAPRSRCGWRRPTCGCASRCWSATSGQHRALALGLAACPARDVVGCLDADLQDPPEAVPALLDRLAVGDVAAVFAGRRGPTRDRCGCSPAGPPGGARAPHRPAAGRRRLPGPRAGARDAVLTAQAPSLVAAIGAARLPVTSVPVRRDAREQGASSWTARARLRQSVRTLAWAARHR